MHGSVYFSGKDGDDELRWWLMGNAGTEAEQWNRSTKDTELNWIIITGLQSGMTYEVRVVAVTDSHHQTLSLARGVMIGSIPGISQWLYIHRVH